MNVLILEGSSRDGGRTAEAVAALTEGLVAGGAAVELVHLLDAKIGLCNQLGPDGFGECLAKGECKIKDGFGPLVERLRATDLAVFATPVYWGEISEITRAFIDRLRRICLNETGKKGIKGKRTFAFCVAGGGGGGSFHSADLLNRILGHCDMDVIDVLPARKQNFDLKLDVLRLTGRWLAKG